MTATTLEQSPFVVGTTPSSVHTDHLYLPTSVGVVAAHLTQDATRPVRAAALLLPPVGYPYHSAYSTMRLLAEALAESGVACLRVDYQGTGNAEGSGWEAERLAAWQTSAEEALAILHSWTQVPVGIVGLQLGGTLALSSGGESDFVVAWEPVTSGRRFVRSLRLLGQATPEALGSSLTFAGFPFPEESLEELARLSLSSWRCQAHDVLVVASEQDRGVLDELAPDMPDVRRVVLPAPNPHRSPSPRRKPSLRAS